MDIGYRGWGKKPSHEDPTKILKIAWVWWKKRLAKLLGNKEVKEGGNKFKKKNIVDRYFDHSFQNIARYDRYIQNNDRHDHYFPMWSHTYDQSQGQYFYPPPIDTIKAKDNTSIHHSYQCYPVQMWARYKLI